MKEILLFAGTTEGRKLSERLAASGVAHTVCVATEYGEIILKEHPLVKLRRGRMGWEEMRAFIQKGGFSAVVDATHPYAEAVTENIRKAVEGMELPCLRLERDMGEESGCGKVVFFETHEECAVALEEIEGNILLTTGSKELAAYCTKEEVRQRLYVRTLPGIESLMLCMEHGISGQRILALQGPFTEEMNEAMLRQYRIRCLVTKRSGRAGGYLQKLAAAEKLDIPVFVVGSGRKREGVPLREVCGRLEEICGRKIVSVKKMEILLAGIGMGGMDGLTRETYRAIESADILLGAERMIAPYRARVEKRAAYTPDTVIPYLRGLQEKDLLPDGGRVAVLFSGDSGFYSGCQALYRALKKELEAGKLEGSVRILPGISSVSYLAACIGESYQDAEIYSMHGRGIRHLAEKLRRAEKVFLLLSGVQDVNGLGSLLTDAGLQDCEVFLGYQMSYPEQRIRRLTPKECTEVTEEGLYTCCIRNPKAQPARLTHGRADGEFIRDKTPMTKEEVREISICKLGLYRGAVAYDIGSGTGSIAVEMAGLSDDIQVFAIEKKREAVFLMEQNREKFHLGNMEIVEAQAPEGLTGLPAATHAFIGGSGGRLREILSVLYRINPKMRVVLNAVSLETICGIQELLTLFPIEGKEIVQVQVSRTRKAGNYHLMQAENPVWICSFSFCEGTEDFAGDREGISHEDEEDHDRRAEKRER